MIVTRPAIVMQGVDKFYGDDQVLDGIDLEVGRGEILALLGPNGAGKTTTIEILEGHRQASAGHVRVLGFDPSTHPIALRERTGVVLQACGFANHLRVGELVDAWRTYYPSGRPTTELLDLVELGRERHALVRHLSGGQRRRLDFALALAGDPDVVFLDEPTPGFDPEARRRCWSAIDNLSSLGKTILLTTHYLDEAERLADRIVILAGGRIRAAGTARALARLARAPTTISFRVARCETPHRAVLDRLGAEGDGAYVTIRTHEPTPALQALLATFTDLPELAVVPASLEDSYLMLVAADDHPA